MDIVPIDIHIVDDPYIEQELDEANYVLRVGAQYFNSIQEMGVVNASGNILVEACLTNPYGVSLNAGGAINICSEINSLGSIYLNAQSSISSCAPISTRRDLEIETESSINFDCDISVDANVDVQSMGEVVCNGAVTVDGFCRIVSRAPGDIKLDNLANRFLGPMHLNSDNEITLCNSTITILSYCNSKDDLVIHSEGDLALETVIAKRNFFATVNGWIMQKAGGYLYTKRAVLKTLDSYQHIILPDGANSVKDVSFETTCASVSFRSQQPLNLNPSVVGGDLYIQAPILYIEPTTSLSGSPHLLVGTAFGEHNLIQNCN